MDAGYSLWPRRMIGKLVEFPGGPKKEGLDYGNTARSSNPPFPDLGSVVKEVKALGFLDNLNWTEYSEVWPEGAICLRTVAVDAGFFVVASRVKPYLENPKVLNGGWYIEACHGAIALEKFGFQSLFQLAGSLRTEQLVERNSDFPPLKLDCSGAIPLPENWFVDVRPLLNTLSSGDSSVICNRRTSVDEFLFNALIAIACLPAALRWRVAVSVGTHYPPEHESLSNQLHLAVVFDGQESAGQQSPAGDAYVKWLEAESDSGSRCHFVGDILTLISSKFPGLSAWDSIDPQEGKSAFHVLDELAELNTLQSWLSSESHDTPDLRHFRHLRSEAITQIANCSEEMIGKTGPFLKELGRADWRNAWRICADTPNVPPALLAIGQALGVVSPFEPQIIASSLERLAFPTLDCAQIIDNVSKQFDRSRVDGLLPAWKPLLQIVFCRDAPEWLNKWGEKRSEDILWGAIQLYVDGGIDVTSEWQNGENRDARAVHLMLRSQEINSGEITAILGNANKHKAVATKLIEAVQKSNPEVATRLAIATGSDQWFEKSGCKVIENSSPALLDSLVQEACDSEELTRPMVQALIVSWGKLGKTQQLELRSAFERETGTNFSSLLYSSRLTSETTLAPDWMLHALRDAAVRSERVGRQILLAVSRNPEFVDSRFLKSVISPIVNELDDTCSIRNEIKSLDFALAVNSGSVSITPFPELSAIELLSLKIWRECLFETQLPTVNTDVRLSSAGQFPVAVIFSGLTLMPPEVLPSFWKEWINSVCTIEHLRTRMLEYVEEADLTESDLWRFARGWDEVGSLRSGELEKIQRAGLVRDFLSLAMSVKSVSPETLMSVLQDASANRKMLISLLSSEDQRLAFHKQYGAFLDNESAVVLWECVMNDFNSSSLRTLRTLLKSGWSRALTRTIRGIAGANRVRSPSLLLALDLFRSRDNSTQREMLERLDHHWNRMGGPL